MLINEQSWLGSMFLTIEKLEKQLHEVQVGVTRGVQPIETFKMVEQDVPEAALPETDDQEWQDFQVEDAWGGYDVVAWFRARVKIPEAWRGQKLALRFLVGPREGGKSTAEALLFVNGTALQAIDVWHELAWLPDAYTEMKEILVAIRAWSGVYGPPPKRHFRYAAVHWIDQATEAFYYRARALLQTIQALPEDALNQARLLEILNEAFLRIDFTRPGSEGFYGSVREAEAYLEEAWPKLDRLDPIRPAATVIGHSHIDMAWMWRLRHTREKARRTFTTVLHLMRQFPEYHFLHTSPQLYAFVQQDEPALFEQIREKVAQGRWEVGGGMWVEPDTNLISGESLVRQILFGKRYARETFGRASEVLVLPDTFGFSAALPQLMRKSGLKYFLTSKISWSQFNRAPYDTFRWRGIDGSEVLAYFVTTPETGSTFYTYNGLLEPGDVKGQWENYQQKEINQEVLHLFGFGDGGGGPTVGMLESGRLLDSLPGIPRARQGRVDDFFQRLAQRVSWRDLPVWDGELYLEYHRGTYTSQGASKRANRRAERLYHDAEWTCALADILLKEQKYPAEALNEGWKMILLNQFHDVLPGSSIRDVYIDSMQQYGQVRQAGVEALEAARGRLLDEGIRLEGRRLVVFNALPWTRTDLVKVALRENEEALQVIGLDGQPLPSQRVIEEGQTVLLVEAGPAPGMGYQCFQLENGASKAEAANEISVTEQRMENPYYVIALNEKGQLTSVWDKQREREVLAPGKRGNVLQAFEDRPLGADAWDIDIYYQEKLREVDRLVECRVLESGPVRGALLLRWQFAESLVSQIVTIYAHQPRIDFRSAVDWHEHKVMLKTAFPVDIRAARASYDIQFGVVERPTHWNTSWDYARFEVAGQKWAELAEPDFGVGLLNDCKYGYDVKENVLRLTLLRSPTEPDPQADQGLHLFTYSLLPHPGSWRRAHGPDGLIAQGYALNHPLRGVLAKAHPQGSLPEQFSLVQGEPDNVIVETVKRSEDGEGWIIRVYESYQNRTQEARLVFGLPPARVMECNLMEEEETPVKVLEKRITFALAPFEIKTFKVWFS